MPAKPVITGARPTPPRLAEAFAASTDLRAFVAQARTRPAEGGSFYALRALSECRLRPPLDQLGEIDAAADRSHAQLRRRSEYIERSHRRCDAFLDDELGDAAVQDLEAQGLAAGDRLVASYRRWTEAVEAGDYEELEAALAEAFKLADPLLLEWIGLTGADYWMRPNGRVLSADNDLRARMVDVWRLLPCELGADCAAGNAHQGPDCLFAGRCEPDRRLSVTADERWGAAPGGHTLDEELQRLLRAIRTGDAKLALGRSTPG